MSQDITPKAVVTHEADALTDTELDAIAGGSALPFRACATGVHLPKQPDPGGPVPMPYPVLAG